MSGRTGLVLVLVWLAGCQAGTRREARYRAQVHRPADELQTLPAEARVEEDIVAYAELCKQELGIVEPLPDMSCLAGVEVPITVNGQKVTEREFRALAEGRGGCDRSQWLDGKCWTYDFLQRVDVGEDVEAVLNCRQKLFTSILTPEERVREYERAVESNASLEERLRLYRLIFEFDDLGLILRNKRSGKTCFFTFFGKLDFERPDRSYAYYGGWIPAPDRKVVATKEEIYDRLPEPKPPEGYPERMWNRGPRGAPGGLNNMFFTPEGDRRGTVRELPRSRSVQAQSVHRSGVRGRRAGRAVERSRRALSARREAFSGFVPEGAGDGDRYRARRWRGAGVHRVPPPHDRRRGRVKRQDWAVGEEVPQPSYVARRFPSSGLDAVRARHRFRGRLSSGLGPMIEALRCCEKNPKAVGCRSRSIGPTEADVKLDSGGLLARRTAGWRAPTSRCRLASRPTPERSSGNGQADR